MHDLQAEVFRTYQRLPGGQGSAPPHGEPIETSSNAGRKPGATGGNGTW